MYNFLFFSFLYCDSSQSYLDINFFGLGSKFSDKPAAFFLISTFFIFCFVIYKIFFPLFKGELLNRADLILFKFYELLKRYINLEYLILFDMKKLKNIEDEVFKSFIISKAINRRKIFYSVYKIKIFSNSLNNETKNHLKNYVNSLKNEIRIKLLISSIELSKKKISELFKKDKKIFINLNNFSINKFKNVSFTERQK